MKRKCVKGYSNLPRSCFTETDFETMHLVGSALMFEVDNRILYLECSERETHVFEV